MYLKIKIKSFHPYYLNRFVILAEKFLKQNFLNINSYIYLPKKIERFTVLTSPHVDKKAREQFERITYKRVLFIKLSNIDIKNKNLLLYRILNLFSILSVGVSFNITYIREL